MQIESLLKKGITHENYCEDAVFHTSIAEGWYIGAVFDGCSSAKESYFAATLMAKLVSKACKTLPYLSKIQPEFKLAETSPKIIGEFILNQVFEGFKKAHNQFLLDEIELLSTIILAVAHGTHRIGWINISGDGFIAINDELIEIDQNNVPDYLSYHLNLGFDEWLKDHTKSYEIDRFEKLHIATDGISKFIDKKGALNKNRSITQALLSVKTNSEQSLKDAYDHLTQKQKLSPFDDIGIIRFE